VPGAAEAPASAGIRLVCNGSTYPCPATGGPFYSTIQAAVDTANPGDWILVWPGVYHEKATATEGVLITKYGLHLRGMDRNLVVVDGSKSVVGETPCPSDPTAQDFTARDGIVVDRANGTYIENLTVCNYLGSDEHGNEVWWNGGDGSGEIGMTTWWGSYLTATSEYADSTWMGMYGIFTSNASGPGFVKNSYASNMGDSAYYVGACQRVCNALLDHDVGENSALGFSGTNAGNYTIQNSEFDMNRAGIVPNSLNNDDAPPPQDGRCPDSTTKSCTFIQHNHVHDNNNPNAPGSGIAGAAPIGAGIEIAGGSYDVVRDNLVENQGGWGIVTHEFPDNETPPASGLSHCQGGTQISPVVCNFPAAGNQVYGNTLHANGFFGNPSNGDLANEATAKPKNCFYDNSFSSSDPPAIQSSAVDGPPCAALGPGDAAILAQLACASGFGNCSVPGANYPQRTTIVLMPLLPEPTMPKPCGGAPANAFCPGGKYSGPTS
jgi:hypothetical protein